MPVIKEICGYPDEVTTFEFSCYNCGTSQTKTVHSSTTNFTHQCNICRGFNEVQVVVCPSCRSSKYVSLEDSNKVVAVYECLSKNCKGFIFQEYHELSKC